MTAGEPGATGAKAGVDPSALVEVINRAQAERAAAEAALANMPAATVITDAEIRAMIDSLGDVGAALNDVKNLVDVTSNLRR